MREILTEVMHFRSTESRKCIFSTNMLTRSIPIESRPFRGYTFGIVYLGLSQGPMFSFFA